MPDAPKFTVDTHIFRELGEMLVGRESTALVELIKNAYDADATRVTVSGEGLDSPATGRIIVTDDGNGMTPDVFEKGFLRVASRLKEEGERRSPRFGRRYTGAKGIGRLAAHKLARVMRVQSIPQVNEHETVVGVDAKIDWDAVESELTLDALEGKDALQVTELRSRSHVKHGTTLELERLRGRWTSSERARFFWEVQTFRPPEVLVETPPKYVPSGLLFDRPLVCDAKSKDRGIEIDLLGDFESGDEYWATLLDNCDWVLEIRCDQRRRVVDYLVSPTRRYLREVPTAEPAHYEIDYPATSDGPFFDARILIREGSLNAAVGSAKTWLGRMTGVRVYLEGFRVLPYGEPSDDWLNIESDYTRRSRVLEYLKDYEGLGESTAEEDEGLAVISNRNYFGAVFLTLERATDLKMLVNREGFIPNAALDALKQTVRIGIDLSVRIRAAAGRERREERRRQRQLTARPEEPDTPKQLKEAVVAAVERATALAKEARQDAAAGRISQAAAKVERAAEHFKEGSHLSDRLIEEPSVMRMLAAIGTQMAAFVHEINGLLGNAQSLELIVERIRQDRSISAEGRQKLAQLSQSLGDLRRSIERQASYLTDITSPDARRRRSRQKLAERFDAAVRLVAPRAEQLGIEIENRIPQDLKSPPMFPAEVTLVFSNLLTNAVKAAKKNGRILAVASQQDDTVRIRLENTGVAVGLRDAERWFRPFESTTVRPDPYLGQGMGMGLPITRNMIEEYGGSIRFIEPHKGFSTALEILLPNAG